MIGQILTVGGAALSGLAELGWIVGRVGYHGAANLAPAVGSVATFVIKGVPAVAFSGVTWAATSSAGNFCVATLAAGGVFHMYMRSTPLTEKEKKDLEVEPLWYQFIARNEAKLLLGLFASFCIYYHGFIKVGRQGIDATFVGAPSWLASKGSTAISSLWVMGTDKLVSVISNPVNWAWLAARGVAKLANFSRNKVLTRDQAMQYYADIYGYDIKDGKAAANNLGTWNTIKDYLLWIENFNLDKEKLFDDYNIQTQAVEVFGELSALAANFRSAPWTSFKAILGTIPKYPKLFSILGFAGLTGLNSGGISGAFSMVTGVTSINKLSGIMWSGPSIVGVFHKPLLYLVNYVPILQPLAHYALVITSETGLAYGSMIISAVSGAISLVTIGRSAVDLISSGRNIKYEEALNRNKFLSESFDHKLKHTVVGKKDDKDVMLIHVINQDINDVAKEFLKFKDKDRDDYIFAFAIKLLGTTKDNTQPNLPLIKEVMKAVMTSEVRGEELPDFIKQQKNLDNYLTGILNVLTTGGLGNIKLADDHMKLMKLTPSSATTRVATNNQQPEDAIKPNEYALLDRIKYPPLELATQVILQKLNKKAELEKANTGSWLG